MAQPLDIPLPELTTDDFKRGWTRFELVAKAKEWDEAKQLTVLPTLLRGKLLDRFVDFDEETKGDLAKLKTALEKAVGRADDPLAAAKAFVSRDQHPNERAEDFAIALKKLFKEAYPSEVVTSSVLLQRFMTGLRPAVSQQLLLRGTPKELSEAIEGATAVEYALSFDKGQTSNALQPTVHALHQPCSAPEKGTSEPKHQLDVLQNSLDEMTKRMEALETALKARNSGSRNSSASVESGHSEVRTGNNSRRVSRRTVTCYFCGENGHIQRNCPALNFSRPARMAGSWPGRS
ncbi:MAG: hypothetical protein ETSY2_41360 [Candidatus Entotheonella gemina]|uniref:CCHC-type domain-containing protein n=1 Tax=Candidatus Entotheonella gemina TaxID=1429439 RepID=W4LMS4_9BACT|nr:MAG: hypothetical protein ETSY2_41360 [Candidatus Entotheonella gemina]